MSRRPARPRPAARPFSDQMIECDIAELGAQGDGIAIRGDSRIFIPYTVAGDRVRARPVAADRAALVEILAKGPGRREPPCPYFGPGKCGGCALQHLDDDAYAAWKAGLAADALARAGADAAVLRPLARTGPGERRRAEFIARVGRDGARIGFHARTSHDIVAIGPCPVLTDGLEALLPALRNFLPGAIPGEAVLEILATQVESGIELVFTGRLSLDQRLREEFARFAEGADLARIAWRADKMRPAEIVAQRRPVQTRFGRVPATLPPGTFLQASAAGERAITAAVAAAVGASRRIADLYAGCGAIALALADEKRRIHAVEKAADMAAALDAAARNAGLGAQIRTESRDLVRRPLIGDELAGLDAVVFDPPREGAAEQAEALAASKVPVVAAVSCNPATFARDARILIRGGYRLTALTPVDQFLWSPHLELVGEFRR